MAASLLIGIMSCSSEHDVTQDLGQVQLNVGGNLLFTRAVDFTKLQNVNNYTIDIYDAGGACVLSKTLGNISEKTVELTKGVYKLTAHYGTEKVASQNDLYLKGETTFSVTAGQTSQVSVECAPTSARVSVAFGDKMDTYFSDYYVTFSTKALDESSSSAVWNKDNTDPWYLKVEDQETVKATITVTRTSDGKNASFVKSTTLSPSKAWALSINAEESEDPQGQAGISVTIDEQTNDIQETITVPDEWWM